MPLINEKIRAPKVQLIDHNGQNLGVISRQDALSTAMSAGLDLVLLSETGNLGFPVVKVMDFGKVIYEKKKKKSESKKHQKIIQVKEIKLSPKIGDHDFKTKMNQVLDFLQDGKRVKITLFFRGRENADRNERGGLMFEKIDQFFANHDLTDNLVQEKDGIAGKLWSRIYYLKQLPKVK